MMKLMLPAAEYRQMSWFGPRLEITRLGRLIPGVGFRFEKLGAVLGQASLPFGTATERKVSAVPAVAVRLNTAAAAVPLVGMSGVVGGTPPGRPERTTRRHEPPVSGALVDPVAVAQVQGLPVPPRESQIRSGGMLWNPPADAPVGAAKYPSTSTITSALPTALNRLIAPVLLNCTIARLASPLPLARLMFEVSGTDPPAGNAVT